MNVIAVKTLKKFWEIHRMSEAPLKAWYKEAEKAEWKSTQDIKKKFQSADFLTGNRVIFNIAGNKFRLIVKIKYKYKIVYIRFVGTHEEYNKIDASKI
jgi:mRNA interferase HigB